MKAVTRWIPVAEALPGQRLLGIRIRLMFGMTGEGSLDFPDLNDRWIYGGFGHLYSPLDFCFVLKILTIYDFQKGAFI